MSSVSWRRNFSKSGFLLVFLVSFTCGNPQPQEEGFAVFPQSYYEPEDFGGYEVDQPADRTFISDIIGISALKFMFLFAVPMIFSIFLGAMLVMLFPFPLLTSTSGLAGAAAIGRRQGRIAEEDEQQLASTLQLLGLPEEGRNQRKQGKRVKKQFKQVPFPVPQRRSISPLANDKKEEEACIERIACELGRENKDPQAKELMDKLITGISRRQRRKWGKSIEAYGEGVKSQTLVIISASPTPPPAPVYRHNVCVKFKCEV